MSPWSCHAHTRCSVDPSKMRDRCPVEQDGSILTARLRCAVLLASSSGVAVLRRAQEFLYLYRHHSGAMPGRLEVVGESLAVFELTADVGPTRCYAALQRAVGAYVGVAFGGERRSVEAAC